MTTRSPSQTPGTRDYAAIAQAARARCQGDRQQRTATLVDILWDALHATGVSWLGFYTPMTAQDLDENAAWEGDGMILGPRRDKPACSPIGMHGACGQSFLSRRTLVIRDVRELGEHYVACDPRDQSELVVPCFAEDGECWGVLDLDSFDIGSFTDDDARGIVSVLEAAQLTSREAVV